MSAGKGYINATVKTTSGAAVKYKSVKFYRDGHYLGTARTNAHGAAKLRVTKYYSNKTYKAIVTGTTTYKTSSLSKVLSWTYQVYRASGTDIIDEIEAVYLSRGSYRVYVYGDDTLYAELTAEDGSYIWLEGPSGHHWDFTSTGTWTDIYASSDADEGSITVAIYRRL